MLLICDIRDLFRDQKHGNIIVTEIMIEITIESGFQYLLENWTIGQNLPSFFVSSNMMNCQSKNQSDWTDKILKNQPWLTFSLVGDYTILMENCHTWNS